MTGLKNIVLVVADSLRRDTFNHILSLHGFNDYPVKQYTMKSMNSNTMLSLPWMLTGTNTYSEVANLPSDLRHIGYSTLLIHSNPIVNRFKHGFDHVIDVHIHHRRERIARRFNRVRDALQKRLPASTYRKVKHLIRDAPENYLPYSRVDYKLETLIENAFPSPYFVWLHLMDPHTPYYPQATGLPKEKIIDLNDNQISAVRGYYTPNMEEVKTWYSLYLQESTEMWLSLNTYLETVDYDKTTVLFTSDHGEEFGEHQHYGHKGNRFNPENIKVPFFIAGQDLPKHNIENHSTLRNLIKTLTK